MLVSRPFSASFFAVALLLVVLWAPAATAQQAALRIRAVGDVMLGTDFPSTDYLPPADGADLLRDVEAWLRDADLTFANLEGPLCDGGETDKCREGSNCYAFRTPRRYGGYLAQAGIDLASLANNHAHDFGDACRQQTIDLMDSLGIAWSGPPGTTASLTWEGLRVGMAAFHTSNTGNHLNDGEGAVRLVEGLAARHDVVIVSFHGGAEGRDALHVPDGREFFYGEDRGDLRAFTHAVVDAGADLVLGHGPHVPRALEVYRGRLIAYSLGNFATYGRFSLGGPLALGLVLEAEVAADGRFVRGRILPTKQVGRGIPRRDTTRATVTLMQDLTRYDFPWSGALILKEGWVLDRGRVAELTPLPVSPLQISPLPPPFVLAAPAGEAKGTGEEAQKSSQY